VAVTAAGAGLAWGAGAALAAFAIRAFAVRIIAAAVFNHADFYVLFH